MVVLEPSCCSVFRDEINELFPSLPQAQKRSKQTFTLADFLENRLHFSAPTLRRKALVHGHCHHKAVMRMKGEESLFKHIGLQYELLDSGCCGMAGSFGFESGKYDLSVKVGERVLLPAVRRAEPSTFSSRMVSVAGSKSPSSPIVPLFVAVGILAIGIVTDRFWPLSIKEEKEQSER